MCMQDMIINLHTEVRTTLVTIASSRVRVPQNPNRRWVYVVGVQTLEWLLPYFKASANNVLLPVLPTYLDGSVGGTIQQSVQADITLTSQNPVISADYLGNFANSQYSTSTESPRADATRIVSESDYPGMVQEELWFLEGSGNSTAVIVEGVIDERLGVALARLEREILHG